MLVFGANATPPLLVALGLAIVSLALFGIVRLYRTRKRPKLELNARVAAWAFGILGLSALLPLPRRERSAVAIGR